jgi:hypothetical protein
MCLRSARAALDDCYFLSNKWTPALYKLGLRTSRTFIFMLSALRREG